MSKRLLITAAIALSALVTATPGLAELDARQLHELALEGHSLFRQANDLSGSDPKQAEALYDKAILRFSGMIEQGRIANWALFYNIGNAHLLKGDLGRAILNYRRAQRLGGFNADVEKNLIFARSRRIDRIVPRAKKKVLQTLFFWHYDIDSRSRLMLACGLWAATCIAGAIGFWRPLGRFLRGVAIVSAIIALLLAGSVMIDFYRGGRNVEGVIVADSVIARQGDGQNYPASFTEPLHSGTEFRQLDVRSGWRRIELADGTKGWIPSDAAETI